MNDFTPVEGVPSQGVYLVTYDEELWLSFPEERKNYCIDTWTKRAQECGSGHMCLRLVPDPLFPRDKENPYIAVRVPITVKPKTAPTSARGGRTEIEIPADVWNDIFSQVPIEHRFGIKDQIGTIILGPVILKAVFPDA